LRPLHFISRFTIVAFWISTPLPLFWITIGIPLAPASAPSVIVLLPVTRSTR